MRKSKKGHILCFDLKWLQPFAVVVVVIYLLLSQTKSMRNDFKERKVWLEMGALKQTNKLQNVLQQGAQKYDLL